MTFDPIEERDATIAAMRADKVEFARWRDKWVADMQTLEAKLAREEDRTEAAEAELRGLREGLRSLADDEFANEDTTDLPEWGGDFERGAMWAFAEAARLVGALLAPSDHELMPDPTGNDDAVMCFCGEWSWDGNDPKSEAEFAAHVRLSSGEAGTVKAWPLPRDEQRRLDNEPCPHCGGDRLRPNFTGDNGVCHAGGRPYDAPVVTPSAEGSE